MKKVRQYKKEVICGVLIILFLLPIMYSILYSLPSADDFSMAHGINRESLFSDSISRMINYYMTWSGGWLYVFLESFLNPVILFGASSGLLGVEMLCFFILFLASIFFVFIAFGKKVLKLETYKILGIIFVFLCVFFNTSIYSEIFYWFVGSSYMWGATLSLVTVGLTILYWKNECRAHMGVAVALVGFVACVSYQCAVFPGMIYLLFWINGCYKEKKLKIKELFPLIVMVAGGLSNVLAPGNFVRLGSSTGEGLQFIPAMKYAYEDLVLVVGEWFHNSIVMAGLCGFVLIGIVIGAKMEYKFRYPIVPFIVSLVCCYIICYPVALGYSKVSMPNRQYFVVNIYALLFFCCSFAYLGGWISKHIRIDMKKIKVISLILICLAVIGQFPQKRYEELPYYKTIANIENMKATAEGWREVFKEIENSDEKELVVRAEYFLFDPPVLRATQLTGKADFWVNMAVAQYYGADWLIIEYYNTPWGY